jgi:NAD(P)H dehydrogenase (quinone)
MAAVTTRLLVLYCPVYGRDEAANAVVETAARAVAEGAGSRADVEAVIRRLSSAAGAPDAAPEELRAFDAVIFVMQTRHGNIPVQMEDFCRQMTAVGQHGELQGKLVSMFPAQISGTWGWSSLRSALSIFLARGMLVVGWRSSPAPDDPDSLIAHALAEARSHGSYVAMVASRLGQ